MAAINFGLLQSICEVKWHCPKSWNQAIPDAMIDQVSTITHESHIGMVVPSRWVAIIEYIAILLMFLSPNTVKGNVALLGSFLGLLWLHRKDIVLDRGTGTFVFACIFFVSLISAVLYFPQLPLATQTDDILKNMAVLLFFLAFPITSSQNVLSKRLVTVMLFMIFLSQLILVFDIGPFSDYILDFYYSDTSVRARTLIDNNGQFPRAGGFLGNANQAAKFLNVLLIAYLVAPRRSSDRTIIANQFWLFGVGYLAAIVLTGSRTGFVISVMIILTALLSTSHASAISRKSVIRIAGGLMVVLLVALSVYSGVELRVFQLGNGIESSLNYKLNLFVKYLSVEKPHALSIFAGNFYSETAPLLYPTVFSYVTFNLDSDLGYFIYTFGALGLIALALKLLSLRKSIPVIFAPLFFWFFSGSLFFHFKFLLFTIALTMLALGNHRFALSGKELSNDAAAISSQRSNFASDRAHQSRFHGSRGRKAIVACTESRSSARTRS